MKNLYAVFVVVLFLFSINTASAQGRFGKDSVDCVKNLSYYLDFAKQKDWRGAYPFWINALKFCPPTASQNLYTHGVHIMKYMIEQTTDPTLRKERIDTLLMLYDVRMANYAVNQSDVLSQKAEDLLTFRPEDVEGVQKLFVQAVMAGKEKTSPYIMITAMQKTIELYQLEKISVENLLNIYTKMSGFAEAQAKANPDDEQANSVGLDLEILLATSRAVSCDKLMSILEPSFKANPQDKDLIIRIIKFLSMNECTSNELYYKAAEAYHVMEPSPLSAYGLARMYLAKGETAKAIQYYKQAIDHSDVTQADRIKYCLEVASVYLKDNNAAQAAVYAKRVIAMSPNNGKTYMLMGNIWAAQKCGGDDIAKKAVFWVAIDYFTKAKSLDASLTEEANKFINTYTQHFPMQQDAFFYDLKDGDAYTVSCNGLTEQTRVRTRK